MLKKPLVLFVALFVLSIVILPNHADAAIEWEAPIQEEAFLTQPFGFMIGYPFRNHKGIDLAIPQKSEVYAAADGKVIKVNKPKKRHKKRPARIVIKHNKKYKSVYAQLNKVYVKKGDRVTAGQLIALSGGKPGTKGSYRSTGPHLHFMIKKKKHFVNPLQFVTLP